MRRLRSRGARRNVASGFVAALVTLTALTLLAHPSLGVMLRAQAPAVPVFRGGTELVLVNVVVRDRSGNVVRGLTRDDFTVSEDNKPQTITSFDFEELDKAPAAATPLAVLAAAVPAARRRCPRPTSHASTCTGGG